MCRDIASSTTGGDSRIRCDWWWRADLSDPRGDGGGREPRRWRSEAGPTLWLRRKSAAAPVLPACLPAFLSAVLGRRLPVQYRTDRLSYLSPSSRSKVSHANCNRYGCGCGCGCPHNCADLQAGVHLRRPRHVRNATQSILWNALGGGPSVVRCYYCPYFLSFPFLFLSVSVSFPFPSLPSFAHLLPAYCFLHGLSRESNARNVTLFGVFIQTGSGA